MIRQTMIAAGLFGLAFAAQPAFAKDDLAQDEARSRVVSIADLDLSTPSGQAALDTRPRRAANDVCDVVVGFHPLAEEMQARRCYKAALANARQTYALAPSSSAHSR